MEQKQEQEQNCKQKQQREQEQEQGHKTKTRKSRYLKAGDSDLKSLVQSRLRFLTLTRSEINVFFFNPLDGRRLSDRRGVYNDTKCVHDDDRLLDVPCDDFNAGDASYPAHETHDTPRSRCRRIARRSQWLDAMLALQDEWWDAALQCAEQFVVLVDIPRSNMTEHTHPLISRTLSYLFRSSAHEEFSR